MTPGENGEQPSPANSKNPLRQEYLQLVSLLFDPAYLEVIREDGKRYKEKDDIKSSIRFGWHERDIIDTDQPPVFVDADFTMHDGDTVHIAYLLYPDELLRRCPNEELFKQTDPELAVRTASCILQQLGIKQPSVE